MSVKVLPFTALANSLTKLGMNTPIHFTGSRDGKTEYTVVNDYSTCKERVCSLGVGLRVSHSICIKYFPCDIRAHATQRNDAMAMGISHQVCIIHHSSGESEVHFLQVSPGMTESKVCKGQDDQQVSIKPGKDYYTVHMLKRGPGLVEIA